MTIDTAIENELAELRRIEAWFLGRAAHFRSLRTSKNDELIKAYEMAAAEAGRLHAAISKKTT